MEPGTGPASDAFAGRGAFVRPLRLASADVVYLMPPLVISDEDLDVLLQEDQSACRNGRLHYGRRKGADGDDGHRGLARNGRDPGGKRRL